MLEIPESDVTSTVADWVELEICHTGSPIARSLVMRCVAEENGREPDEGFTGDVWEELTRRLAMYNPAPYIVEARQVRPAEGYPLSIEYHACLMLSLFGGKLDTDVGPRLFERLVRHAVASWLDCQAVIFGSPLGNSLGGDVGARVRTVASRMNERFIESPAERFNERGVDVIAWKPLDLRRSNQIALLIQCKAGLHWRSETTKLPEAAWREYIHWACCPIKGFAVPCVIPQSEWHDVSKDAGLLLDRPRILNEVVAVRPDGQLRNELTSWVTAKMAEIAD